MTEQPEEDKAVQSLQGTVPDVSTDEALAKAVEDAFDYRGDVTVETRDGRVLDGYLYDRVATGEQPRIRMMPADGSARVTLPYDQIAAIRFTGKDAAWGKSWEAWVRKHEKMKAKGEEASIEGQPLDDDDAAADAGKSAES